MIQRTTTDCMLPDQMLRSCCVAEVGKSQFVAVLKRENAKLWGWLEERDDAIHEARRHLLAGDLEAAIQCLQGSQG